MRNGWWPIVLVMIFCSGVTDAQVAVDTEIAPTGKFRVGMNANNSTLVMRNADGTVSGLSADLGRFIAARLGVPYEPVLYESSSPFTASFGKSDWDIIVTGKNAVVVRLVDFSADLFLIEYVYLAAPGREFAGPEQVDAPGIRIAVPRNASADVFLSKALKSAELVRVDGDLNVAIAVLRSGKADVYASSINSLRVMAGRMPGARIVGAFHTVTFAVAMRKGLSAAAQNRLTRIVNDAKAAGIVQKGLEQAGAQGVRVAP